MNKRFIHTVLQLKLASSRLQRSGDIAPSIIVFVLVSLYPSNLATNLDNHDGVGLVNLLGFLVDRPIFVHPKTDPTLHGKGRVRNVDKRICLSGYHISFSEMHIQDIAPFTVTFFPRKANEPIVLTVFIFV